ncbi:MAG: antibiotic transport system permease protein [Candidatus Berkelbacteria bacterium Licking1014_85]|uniref:Transport permease protein n=1 Tax=Candidatus Berkelbacteria bacterium Licking1014_85 TaxID=2017148 RepID=A0A554LHI4_9BACT|nr:MAG: antibiotic transport system permease protein [Candidatus Berkelbacteria bacterium Licking1014_85]
MIKLFFANLKMLVRNRQASFWMIMFPLMFTIIFGLFFSGGSSSIGSVAIFNESDAEIAKNIEKTIIDSKIFKINNEFKLDEAKNEVLKTKLLAVILIPQNFGSMMPVSPKTINIFVNPANGPSNSIVTNLIDKILTNYNFAISGAQPIFSVKSENVISSSKEINYYDFILLGIIGMALMNSAIMGLAVSMAKYREDKILKRLITTPMPGWKFIAAELMARLVFNFIQVSIILGVGVYGFNAHIYGNIYLIYFLSLIGALMFQLIGFTIASLSKTTAAAEGMSTAIAIPMMFLAGVFFPIDQLPNWLFKIVQYLPLAPLLRLIRSVGTDSGKVFDDPQNIIIISVWIVITLLFSIFRFKFSEE